mmetsp:Transcript_4160/g.5122  ORF Transcript_4160/g.5122 Transcript_4160/m.5122 type:complete len:84 (-) Transcript_4160:908-1159(-)
MLINSHLHVLQRVCLVLHHFLFFKLVGGLSLLKLVAKVLRDHFRILYHLFYFVHFVLILFAELANLSLEHHQLLGDVEFVVIS